MSQPTTYAPVVRSITVATSRDRAFKVFTEQIGTWWPKEYSIGEADMADFVVEPKVGGRWYEVGADGVECDTGRVLVCEPPERVVFAWHLNGEWQFDPDPDHASEVEVRFVAEAPGRTRVELEHRNLERHGPGWEPERDAVGGEGGWPLYLQRFGQVLAERD
jgi:uncharacterized protein YndB with AHSA1/START domain